MNTHQQLRANLWCNIATGLALLPEVTGELTPTKWADHILNYFDERFPEPQGPVDTDPDVSILLAERETLRADLETERMKLAAIGVVACADTPESAASARQMLPEHRSAALDDVERRVDECIALRKDKEERSLLIRQLQNALKVAREDRDKLHDMCIEVTSEQARLLRLTEEHLEVNRQWDAVDTFVRNHPSTTVGQHVCRETLRMLRERDLYHSQLRAHGITPARIS